MCYFKQRRESAIRRGEAGRLRTANFIFYALNGDVNEADDAIANEHDNECDIGYVNADVFEYDNEYESVNVNDCDYVYVYENVYDNE